MAFGRSSNPRTKRPKGPVPRGHVIGLVLPLVALRASRRHPVGSHGGPLGDLWGTPGGPQNGLWNLAHTLGNRYSAAGPELHDVLLRSWHECFVAL